MYRTRVIEMKILQKLKSLLPTKRRLIQLYAALLTNANLKGYISGKIYTGDLKGVCSPGLNCYSCPGAVGACPLGSLQNSLSAANKSFPFYVFGILILYGIILGRWICGFLCPFGLVQDLLHKIKTPKLKKSRITKALSILKYVILVLFVFIIPLAYMLKDFPLPAFCKYICPAGTFGGALGLLINPSNSTLFELLGPLFTWKFALMCSIIVGAIFVYRIFCRFLCPLGALYGLFNRFSVLGIKLEKPKCIDCGLCVAKCKMDISEVGDRECIMCGECISVCPTKAITWRGSKIILPENEIESVKADESLSDEEREAKLMAVNKRRSTRVTVLRIVAAVLMVTTLAGALYYYNFVDGSASGEGGEANGDGPTLDPAGTGKVTVINFWYTDCSPCKQELPHFNQIASEYSDTVNVVTVHRNDEDLTNGEAVSYINTNYSGSNMIFLKEKSNPKNAYYVHFFGEQLVYPNTVVVDQNGIITKIFHGKISYEELKSAVDAALLRPQFGNLDSYPTGNTENLKVPAFELEYVIPPEN